MKVSLKCSACGYVYEGDGPPEKCPICNREFDTQEKKGEEEMVDLHSLTTVDIDTNDPSSIIIPDSSVLCKSVLGNLLTLRSSIRVIYDIQEKIDELREENDEVCSKYDECSKKIREMKSTLIYDVGDEDDVLEIKEQLLKNLEEKNYASDIEYAGKVEKKFKLINILGTIFISLGLFTLVFLLMLPFGDIALAIGNSVASGLVPGVVYFFITFKLAKDHSYSRVLAKRKIKNRDDYLKSEYQSDLERTIANKKSELERMIEETKAESRQYMESCRNLVFDMYTLSQDLRSEVICLDELYCEILHKSDWENIDYIIYVFVTGRADTLKEALHMVDEQRRAEMIVGAIDMASNYLANNISSTIYLMRNELSSSFNQITTHLANIRNSISLRNAQNKKDITKIIELDKKMCDYSVKSYDMIKKINNTLNK